MQEMKSWVARAFLNKLLNDEERKDLRKYERSIRHRSNNPRSYLVGFEIIKRYNLKPEPLVESQMSAMDALYYKYIDMTEKHHNDNHLDKSNPDAKMPLDCDCPVELDAIYAWEDWASEQMEKSYDWRMALTLVLVLLTLVVR